ncbi:MAG: TSUP family transporter [bacterium]|nr:TSUP family transporter [bacterium]
MLSYLVICSVALIASALTLFSGFGLGTLLLPAFALFFPIEVAVASTAIVHLANNVFKIALVGRHAVLRLVIAFGVPALLAALVGARLLATLAGGDPLLSYAIGGREHVVTPVKLVVGLLILVFSVFELSAAGKKFSFRRPHLVWGGLLAGFFGGLSGHQGALRSAFLIQSGITKEAYIGTGVACAVLVDIARLAVYAPSFWPAADAADGGVARGLMFAATAAAFVGAFVGVRLMRKVTLDTVRKLVGVLLILLSLGLASGLI